MFSTVTATRFPETVTAMTAVLSDSVAQSPLMSTFRPLLRCSRTVPDAGLSASVVVDATDGSVQVLVDGGEADPVHSGALEGGGLWGCKVGSQLVAEDDEDDVEDVSDQFHGFLGGGLSSHMWLWRSRSRCATFFLISWLLIAALHRQAAIPASSTSRVTAMEMVRAVSATS